MDFPVGKTFAIPSHSRAPRMDGNVKSNQSELERLERLVLHFPDDPSAHTNLANYLITQKNYESAYKHLSESFELDRRNSFLLLKMAFLKTQNALRIPSKANAYGINYSGMTDLSFAEKHLQEYENILNTSFDEDQKKKNSSLFAAIEALRADILLSRQNRPLAKKLTNPKNLPVLIDPIDITECQKYETFLLQAIKRFPLSWELHLRLLSYWLLFGRHVSIISHYMKYNQDNCGLSMVIDWNVWGLSFIEQYMKSQNIGYLATEDEIGEDENDYQNENYDNLSDSSEGTSVTAYDLYLFHITLQRQLCLLYIDHSTITDVKPHLHTYSLILDFLKEQNPSLDGNFDQLFISNWPHFIREFSASHKSLKARYYIRSAVYESDQKKKEAIANRGFGLLAESIQSPKSVWDVLLEYDFSNSSNNLATVIRHLNFSIGDVNSARKGLEKHFETTLKRISSDCKYALLSLKRKKKYDQANQQSSQHNNSTPISSKNSSLSVSSHLSSNPTSPRSSDFVSPRGNLSQREGSNLSLSSSVYSFEVDSKLPAWFKPDFLLELSLKCDLLLLENSLETCDLTSVLNVVQWYIKNDHADALVVVVDYLFKFMSEVLPIKNYENVSKADIIAFLYLLSHSVSLMIPVRSCSNIFDHEKFLPHNVTLRWNGLDEDYWKLTVKAYLENLTNQPSQYAIKTNALSDVIQQTPQKKPMGILRNTASPNQSKTASPNLLTPSKLQNAAKSPVKFSAIKPSSPKMSWPNIIQPSNAIVRRSYMVSPFIVGLAKRWKASTPASNIAENFHILYDLAHILAAAYLQLRSTPINPSESVQESPYKPKKSSKSIDQSSSPLSSYDLLQNHAIQSHDIRGFEVLCVHFAKLAVQQILTPKYSSEMQQADFQTIIELLESLNPSAESKLVQAELYWEAFSFSKSSAGIAWSNSLITKCRDIVAELTALKVQEAESSIPETRLKDLVYCVESYTPPSDSIDEPVEGLQKEQRTQTKLPKHALDENSPHPQTIYMPPTRTPKSKSSLPPLQPSDADLQFVGAKQQARIDSLRLLRAKSEDLLKNSLPDKVLDEIELSYLSAWLGESYCKKPTISPEPEQVVPEEAIRNLSSHGAPSSSYSDQGTHKKHVNELQGVPFPVDVEFHVDDEDLPEGPDHSKSMVIPKPRKSSIPLISPVKPRTAPSNSFEGFGSGQSPLKSDDTSTRKETLAVEVKEISSLEGISKQNVGFGAQQKENAPVETKPTILQTFGAQPKENVPVEAKPAISFQAFATKPKENTPVETKPAISLQGFAAKPKENTSVEAKTKENAAIETKPAISFQGFGVKPKENAAPETKPAISFQGFGAKPKENTPIEAKPAVSFQAFGIQPKENTPVEAKAAISFQGFGAKPKENAAIETKPIISFGNQPKENTPVEAKPAISFQGFGAKPKENTPAETKPATGFIAKPKENAAIETKPAVSFQAFGIQPKDNTPAETKPAISFEGFGAKPKENTPAETKPAIGFIAKPKENPPVEAKLAISFQAFGIQPKENAAIETKPVISFGNQPKENTPVEAKPAISFQGFGAKPKENSPVETKPAISFQGFGAKPKENTSVEAKPVVSFQGFGAKPKENATPETKPAISFQGFGAKPKESTSVEAKPVVSFLGFAAKPKENATTKPTLSFGGTFKQNLAFGARPKETSENQSKENTVDDESKEIAQEKIEDQPKDQVEKQSIDSIHNPAKGDLQGEIEEQLDKKVENQLEEDEPKEQKEDPQTQEKAEDQPKEATQSIDLIEPKLQQNLTDQLQENIEDQEEQSKKNIIEDQPSKIEGQDAEAQSKDDIEQLSKENLVEDQSSKAALEDQPRETGEDQTQLDTENNIGDQLQENIEENIAEDQSKESAEDKHQEIVQDQPKDTAEETKENIAEQIKVEPVEEKDIDQLQDNLTDQPKDDDEEKQKENLEDQSEDTTEEQPLKGEVDKIETEQLHESVEDQAEKNVEHQPNATIEDESKDDCEDRLNDNLADKSKDIIEDQSTDVIEGQPKHTDEDQAQESIPAKAPKDNLEHQLQDNPQAPKENIADQSKESVGDKLQENVEDQSKDNIEDHSQDDIKAPKQNIADQPEEKVENQTQENLEAQPTHNTEEQEESQDHTVDQLQEEESQAADAQENTKEESQDDAVDQLQENVKEEESQAPDAQLQDNIKEESQDDVVVEAQPKQNTEEQEESQDDVVNQPEENVEAQPKQNTEEEQEESQDDAVEQLQENSKKEESQAPDAQLQDNIKEESQDDVVDQPEESVEAQPKQNTAEEQEESQDDTVEQLQENSKEEQSAADTQENTKEEASQDDILDQNQENTKEESQDHTVDQLQENSKEEQS